MTEDDSLLSEATAMDQTMAEMEAALQQDDSLTTLAQAHERMRSLESKAEKLKKEIVQRITARLDSLGVDSVRAGERVVGFSTRTYVGVNQGASPEQHAQNLRALHAWLQEYAPEKDVPASTGLNAAFQAYLDRNPGATMPEFLTSTETRTLTNRKAT